jgi:hypothetical protein
MKKLLAILVTAGALSVVPVAAADTGTPVGPGGCNMLTPDFSSSPIGTAQMMAGSSHSNGGIAVANMLALFPPPPAPAFCGAYS